MGPDLQLDPDAVARLAATVRRIADGLPAGPEPHGGSVGDAARSIRDAAAELRTFAVAAEATARRVRNADQAVTHELRVLASQMEAGDHRTIELGAVGPGLALPGRCPSEAVRGRDVR